MLIVTKNNPIINQRGATNCSVLVVSNLLSRHVHPVPVIQGTSIEECFISSGIHFKQIYYLDNILDELTKDNTVAAGMAMTPYFLSAAMARTGVLRKPKASDTINGYHAVEFVGYGDGYLFTRNTWGPSWGIDGHFKMPYEFYRNPYFVQGCYTISDK